MGTQSIVCGPTPRLVVLISIRKFLVDLEDPKQLLLINASFIKKVDIYKVKAEDLTFISPICLQLKRNKYIYTLTSASSSPSATRGPVFLWSRVFSVQGLLTHISRRLFYMD